MVLALLPRKLVTSAVGATGAALFVLAAAPLILAQASTAIRATAGEVQGAIIREPLPEAVSARPALPDIIYMVPDRYGSSSVLARSFDHDNRPFLEALRRRGFAVAEGARANYLRTRASIASTMNMQYLEPFLSGLDGNVTSYAPLYDLISGNLVVRRLKGIGYQYVHVGSWWDGTRQSLQSDAEVNFWPFGRVGGELGMAVGSRSLAFMTAVTVIGGDWGWTPCAALKAQLRFLETVGGKDRPTFVFAHVLAPHTPILTDAEGHCIEPIDYPNSASGLTWEAFAKGYSEYVDYLNRRILEIFDTQKARNPNSLIFVAQADEGPWPKAFRVAAARKIPFDWLGAGNDELAMKFGIFNALYFDDDDGTGDGPTIPNDLSPVNNWRLIFGYLEGKEYPLLPNRHFLVGAGEDSNRSVEITERLEALPR